MEYKEIVKYYYDSKSSTILKDTLPYKCRFCEQVKTKKDFSNIAHSVAELLGNKSIINKYECNDCNKSFSEKEENELGKMILIYKAFRGLRGKKGNIKINSNISFDFDDNDRTLNVKLSQFSQKNLSFCLYKNANGRDVIRLQNHITLNGRLIYRAFLKFVLSVVPEYLLNEFKAGFEFLKKDDMRNGLLVGCIVYNQIKREYKTSIYQRNDKKSNFPKYIGLIDMYQQSFIIYLDFNNKCNYIPDILLPKLLKLKKEEFYQTYTLDYSFIKKNVFQVEEATGKLF